MNRVVRRLLLSSIFTVSACGSDVAPVIVPDAPTPTKATPGLDTVRASDTTRKISTDTLVLPMDSIRLPKDTSQPVTPPAPPPTPPPPPPVTPPAPPPVVPGVPYTGPDTVSPTGRSPRLIWTPQRQAMWIRMQREGHPLFQLLQNNCLAAVSGSPRYGDRGLWCALLYQITGNVTYARTAWNLVLPALMGPPSSGNDAREETIENAVLYDWLYPALSPAERDVAVAGLNSWAGWALAIGTPAYVGGIRIGDGDANVGYYFGLAAIDLATVGHSAHVNWLNATQTNGSVVPIGGLDPTGIDRQTLRNTVAWFVTQNGNGGEWDESTEYNLGTQVLLAMGAEAIKTATGVDHFPEVTAYLAAAARSQSYFITPDLNQTVQWGDIEHPREFTGRLWTLDTWLGTLAGVTENSGGAGAYTKGLLEAIFSRYGMTGYLSGEPWARFFLFYNPYAASVDWNAVAPAKFFQGSGHLFVRAQNELFEARMASRTFEDHELHYLSNFQLYRNGEWAITHPQGYAGTANQAIGVNSLLLAGLNAMSSRGADATQSGNNWWSITGSTNGMFYDMPYYDPPPSFVRTASRTVVFLQRNGLDLIVVQDAIDMDDPKSLPNYSRYRAADAAAIAAAPGLIQWVMHAPVAPNVNGNVASWSTPGGQQVSVTTLSPTPSTTTISQERSVLSTQNYVASELNGYQMRVTPVGYTGGQIVLRHVIVVGGQAPAMSLNGNTITIGGTTVTISATVTVTN